jgi:CBS domain-containing protein
MKARDVMVSPVITVMPSCSVKEVAQTLLKNHISGVPVVDDQGRVVGIVSEGDLLRRAEAGTEQRRSWWLRGLVEYETLAAEYIKANSRKVAEVMVRDVIIADPDTPLDEIATLMEQKSIKRVPIVGGTARRNRVSRQSRSGSRVEQYRIRIEARGRVNSRKADGRFEGATVGSYGAIECHRNRRTGASLGHHVFRNRKTSNLRGR